MGIKTASNDMLTYENGYKSRWGITSVFKYITGSDNRAISNIFKKFEMELNNIEQEGVLFYTENNIASKYYGDIHLKINGAARCIKWVRENKFTGLDKTIEQIQLKIIAARYRMMGVKMPEDQRYDPNTTVHKDDFVENPKQEKKDLNTQIEENKEALLDLANTWKDNQPAWKGKKLDDLQRGQIEKAAAYVKWVPLLLKNPKLQHDFFKWALQDFLDVEVFITCPNTVKRLKKAYEHSASGCIQKGPTGEKDLCFIEKEIETPEGEIAGTGKRKYLTLPFYTGIPADFQNNIDKIKRVDILNPKTKVTFCGGLVLTIEEIFKQRANLNNEVPDISRNAYGDMNFNAKEWGYWDYDDYVKKTANQTWWQRFWYPVKKSYIKTIDIQNDPKWYEKLPPTTILSEELLRTHHGKDENGNDKVDGKTPFVEVCATRTEISWNCMGAHGFAKLYFPLGDIKKDGKNYYHVVDIGKFGQRYANGIWDNLALFCGTILAIIMCLDPNGLYDQRQIASLAIFSEEEGDMDKLIESLRQILLKQSCFQFAGENCAAFIEKWIHKVFTTLAPIFSVGIFSGQTGMPYIDGYLKKFEKCYRFIQFLGVLPILLLACAWRWVTIKESDSKGKEVFVRKSVFKTVWNKIMNSKPLHNPAALFYLDNPNLKITFGNTERLVAQM
jgi:hypothetical protein